jgi:hypothetical protein
MRGQTTTQPDMVNPFAATADASPAEIRRQAEAVWKRIGKTSKRAALREPELFWEEPGLHGTGMKAKLRSPQLASSKVGRGRLPAAALSSARLPPMPARRTSRSMSTGELAVVGGVVVGVGALAWYLWKQRQPVVIHMEPTKVQGLVGLPDWAMT